MQTRSLGLILLLISFSAGTSVSAAEPVRTGLWDFSGADGCASASAVIKKIEASRSFVELDQSSACFGGSRSNSASFVGEARVDSTDSNKLHIDLNTDHSYTKTIEPEAGKVCEITLRHQRGELVLDFQNCLYADSGGQKITGSTLKAVSKYEARPSFKCGQKLSVIEQVICNNRSLGTQDVEVATLFQKVKANPSTRTSQIAWLKSRDECLAAPTRISSCLSRSYDARIEALKSK